MFMKENKLTRTQLVKKNQQINANECVMLLAIYDFMSVDGDVEIYFDM